MIIVIVSEVSKRSILLGAIIISVPLTSILAFIWLYFDTKEVKPVVDHTNSILLLIPPSLTFFVVLPLALKKLDFIYSIFISIIATVLVYWLYIALLSRLGIRL